MKKKILTAGLTGLILFITLLPGNSPAQPSLHGGWSAAAVTNHEVITAAVFALRAEHVELQPDRSAKDVRLELVRILAAQQQVVAGMNYEFKLKVRLNGVEKEADAIIWWQAWRTPNPYELTSWTWQ
jgi:hypothetical protein